MTEEELKTLITAEVPRLVRQHPEFRIWLEDFSNNLTLPSETADERFDRIQRQKAEDERKQKFDAGTDDDSTSV